MRKICWFLVLQSILKRSASLQNLPKEYINCLDECTPKEEVGPRGKHGTRGIKGEIGDDCFCCDELNTIETLIKKASNWY